MVVMFPTHCETNGIHRLRCEQKNIFYLYKNMSEIYFDFILPSMIVKFFFNQNMQNMQFSEQLLYMYLAWTKCFHL